MAEAGWVNVNTEGTYEVQRNIYSDAYRHRLHKPDVLFHDWFDGEPPFRFLKDSEEDS